MDKRWPVAVLVSALACLVSCTKSGVTVEPGVSLALAQSRAAVVSNVQYRLRFDIPEQAEAPIPARIEISFDLSNAELPLQLDFRQEDAAVLSVRNNGDPVDYRFGEEHILIPASSLRRGRNQLDIEFLAGSSSLNRNPGYLYTLFVPDRARTAFPLFDQPDIKARYELTLVVPTKWQALSSAPLAELTTLGERREFRFEQSDLMSSYLFSFVAGEFESVTREVGGRKMTMLHRETDNARLERNLDAIFQLHGASLDWMEQYTAIDYPFRKFDFALIPSFQYGGMEHVGAIQYRASSLLLDEFPSATELLGRAQLIAHETAHMWFGDLVTMRWFDDVWTKEVFANFMADKIVNPAFEEIDHGLKFLVGHYPPAYAVDRTEAPNPIRQVLPNLSEAGQMYGSIIYHKAPIMMRQLELLVGETAFREGMREYLRRYANANASWPELVAILDALTEIDLEAWSHTWVATPGRPRFRLCLKAAGEPQLCQEDPGGMDRVWPQQFAVLALSGNASRQELILSGQAPASLPDIGAAPGHFIHNADGLGYGLFPLDMDVFGYWQDLGELVRGVLLIDAWENLLEGAEADPQAYLDLLLAIVAQEREQLLLELALSQVDYIFNTLLSERQHELYAERLAATLWQTLQEQEERGPARLLFKAYARLAIPPEHLHRILAIWSGEQSVEILSLSEDDLIELAQVLAIRLPEESGAIIRRQLSLTENPDRRRKLEFLAPALAPAEGVRDAFFESLGDKRNRHTEAWVEDAVALLHHPGRLAQSEKYLLPSLELLQEIQVTGDIFFPSAWLLATFRYHHSPAAVQVVRGFLEQHPDYNEQLRMKILQAADPMFRASRIRAAQRDPDATTGQGI